MKPTFNAVVTWTFEDAFLPYDEIASSVPLAEYLARIKSLKSRKNFANSSSGANVQDTTAGIVNKNAVLSANDESYLTLS